MDSFSLGKSGPSSKTGSKAVKLPPCRKGAPAPCSPRACYLHQPLCRPSDTIFASDASLAKGAFCEAPLDSGPALRLSTMPNSRPQTTMWTLLLTQRQMLSTAWRCVGPLCGGGVSSCRSYAEPLATLPPSHAFVFLCAQCGREYRPCWSSLRFQRCDGCQCGTMAQNIARGLRELAGILCLRAPFRKEFVLGHLLDLQSIHRKCLGNHHHLRIEGSITKQSAIYHPGLRPHLQESLLGQASRAGRPEGRA